MNTFYWGIEYMAVYVEIFMSCIFCGTFLAKEKLSEQRELTKILSMIGAAVVCLLNSYKLFSYINFLAVVFLYILFQKILYKRQLFLSVALSLIYCAILSATDFLTVYTASIILQADSSCLLNQHSIIRSAVLVFSKVVLILVITGIDKISRIQSGFSRKYIGIMGICSLFVLFMNVYMVQGNMSNQEMKSILFFSMLSIEVLIFYLVCKFTENYEKQQIVSLVELKNEMLQKSLDETEQTFQMWRASIHDYKNNIISLTQLVEDGNIEEIRRYLQKENRMLDKKMFCIKTGNSVVDAIVNTKQNLAEKKNIVFYVNAAISERCLVKAIDIANILGNLIDNAIEACEGKENAYVDIAVREEKKFLVIKVANFYTGELPKNMHSTKKDKVWHGIGIKSVKSMVEKYDGQYEIKSKQGEVVTSILLLNKEIRD